MAQAENGGSPREVTTAVVVQAALVRSITVTGTLAAEDQVALGFKVPGRLAEVSVDLGSPVKQGQVVARLIPTDYELRVQQAEAALVQARVRLGLTADGSETTVDPEKTALVRQRRAVAQEARLNRDRMQTFVDRGISARATLDAAIAALEVAEGQYQDALEEIRTREAVLSQRQSELEIARQQLEDTVLRAPFDGGVRERQVAIGEYRGSGEPVVTPERETADLKSGLHVIVRVEGDSTGHNGRLERIGAAIDETNRTLPVEAMVPNEGDLLRPGQFATAEIVLSESDRALVVPLDAIVTFAGVQKVLTVENGHASEHRIRTGRRDGERVEVLEGLAAGDIVIRDPGDLVDGVPVLAGDSE